MANEFLNKPPSIRPAITGAIADPDEYNQNIAGQSKDSVTFIDKDGLFVDGNLGDEALGANGSLTNLIKLRQGGLLKFYNASGVFVNDVNLGQATESLIGQAAVATQADVQGKTNDTDFITSLKLAQAMENVSFGGVVGLYGGNATYSKPSNLRYLVVEVIGGGGGGYDGTISVSAGGNGGTSSFGSHCSATGGQGGQTGLTPASGGLGLSGNVNLQGGHAKGHSGGFHGENWSMGGDISPFGYGGMAVNIASGRNYSRAPTGFGAGGGGRLSQQAVASAAGAAGGYSKKFLLASQVNATESIVIGAGGSTPTGGLSSAGAGGLVIVTEYKYN